MKEYYIVFEYRPGTMTKAPEHVFVELEDETGQSISAGAWVAPAWNKDGPTVVKPDGLVTLVLPAPDPTMLEELEECLDEINTKETA